MNSNTLLRGKIIDPPIGIDGFENDLILLKLSPYDGPFLFEVSIVCKGSLARILVNYFKSGTMVEIQAGPAEIEDSALPIDIPKPVLSAESIKFLYIQKAKENAAFEKMVS